MTAIVLTTDDVDYMKSRVPPKCVDEMIKDGDIIVISEVEDGNIN